MMVVKAAGRDGKVMAESCYGCGGGGNECERCHRCNGCEGCYSCIGCELSNRCETRGVPTSLLSHATLVAQRITALVAVQRDPMR
jgi:hypothetical protein